jgi:hypothetical protein
MQLTKLERTICGNVPFAGTYYLRPLTYYLRPFYVLSATFYVLSATVNVLSATGAMKIMRKPVRFPQLARVKISFLNPFPQSPESPKGVHA